MVDYILQEVFDVTIYPIYFVSSSFEKKVKEKWLSKPIFEFQINREKWHHLKLEDTKLSNEIHKF